MLPLRLLLPILVVLRFASAQGQPTFASLHGTVKTPAGIPANGTTVLVHNNDENSDRTATAAADGTFAVGSLTPGHYQLTARRQGFADSSATAVELAPGQALDLSLTLGPAAPPGAFFKRLFRAYSEDWKGTAISGPAPPSRLPPSPINSPPFPNSDWSYGGAPDIGS